MSKIDQEQVVMEQGLQQRLKELQTRATKDALSGLLNRMTAEQYITARLNVMGPGDTCALFIVDLDDFKRVNDTLGHQAGDQAICHSAQILSKLFCASDIVGRLGGDEFLIFTSGRVTEEGARRQGSAICEELQLALGEGPSLEVTASVGIHLSSGGTFEELYRLADQALYAAKKGGKHCYCLTQGEGPDQGQEQFRPVNAIPVTGLLEHLESGVALLEMGDPLQLLYASPSFFRILGADDRDIATFRMPCPLSRLIHPDDWLDVERAFRQGAMGEHGVEHTHRVSCTGKDWRWWNVRAVKVDYDAPYPVLLVTTTDISQFKENERRLEEVNQRLQIALEQSTHYLWEVDLASKTFRLFGRDGIHVLSGEEGSGFPDWLLENGWVHPDSTARFQEFAQDLLSGHVQGHGNFILRSLETGSYVWTAVSYRAAFDEMGRPTRAVGIVEDLPRDPMIRETTSILHRPLPQALRQDLILAFRADLSRDSLQDLWLWGEDLGGRVWEISCTQALVRTQGAIFREEDRRRYASYFSPQALLERFHKGERWLWAEYQRVDANGNICWARHIADLVEDPLTQDVYLFLYVLRLDRRRAWERAAPGMTLRDPVTQLYTRAAGRAMAQAILSRQEAGECAVALLTAGGLGQLCGEGTAALDKARSCLAMAFLLALGSGCLLVQYSQEQILAFFPKSGPRHELRARLEEAFDFVRLVMVGTLDLEDVRFVAGVVTGSPGSADVGIMAIQAASLCQFWRNASSDTVTFPRDGDAWTWEHLRASGGDDVVTVHQHGEMERPLSDGEKDLALHCMSAMLSADSLEASLHGVLRYIGDYYRADRVYLLILAPNGQMVTMPYEWLGVGKHSIQHAVSGVTLDRFPILQRCLEEKAPVFLSRESPISLQGEPPAGGDPWHFTVFPLAEGEAVLGFLCIENAREHPADAALFTTLIPYILRERDRYRGRPGQIQESAPASGPMDPPDLRSYLETIYSMDSSRYSSMGVVCLDVPDLSDIYASLGLDHGSQMLWYISKALADVFGSGWIFRTADAEFVALCPNTTQQVFDGRFFRLESLLQRRYPKELRTGRAWSGGTFRAKELIREARSLMRGQSVKSRQAGGLSLPGAPSTVGDAAQSGRFTVYFQPQVDMETGAVYGAEALVRGIDDDGSLVPPGAFISQLEQTGEIRELDYFVLDRTLSLMERWIAQGLAPLHISVNLSRVTFFDPTALASVLAIQSRYPSVPLSHLELEITESAGDVESSVLQATIDQFRQCGFRFGLDDFGSKYSNLPIFTNVRFDTVKLDRSLILSLASNPINQMLIQDIIQICKACEMTCIAEGVETPAQIDALRETGCRYAQGYYYDRPMPAEAFVQKYMLRRAGAAGGATIQTEEVHP